MAHKSTNRNHIEKSSLLKQLRKDAGLTQDELAQRMKVTRDVISHIENCHLQQMDNLKTDFEDKWWEVCQYTARPETKASWRSYILNKFGF